VRIYSMLLSWWRGKIDKTRLRMSPVQRRLMEANQRGPLTALDCDGCHAPCFGGALIGDSHYKYCPALWGASDKAWKTWCHRLSVLHRPLMQATYGGEVEAGAPVTPRYEPDE
jgi:hypothetical protein